MTSRELHDQLIEMEGYTDNLTTINSAVSSVPVGWHLAHNLKVILSILKGLDISDPAQYRKKFSWKKELVYLTGRIPRGKARAPKKVIPEDNISAEELQEQITKAKRKLTGISKLPKNAFFEHPFFGHIRRDETPKFLVIHTEHHLKIVREILNNRA
ncbi:DUF1569 domain-containing protein [Salinimicrobium xinjiangense]|uniref:DUF1569 domain-containing protein n=1 Tax=Salinimicrobium xinjiangense TaxID=438596 RepID=UPI000566BD8D|nr:DUF1569 domain-containing protein [Salinimicrobium xinjiangense]